MLKSFFTLLILVLTGLHSYGQPQKSLYDQQTEYLINPLGIDAPQPRFTWKISDRRQGAHQRSYQILVGTDSIQVRKGKGNVWDSGKINGTDNLAVYEGTDLQPFTKYYWQVLSWDADGKKYSGAGVASFETGMMDPSNWQGSWISDNRDIDLKPAPYFRKVIKNPKKIKTARAYIAVAGLYELYINGEKVGNHRLDPVYTRFDKRNVYVSYDVSEKIKQGENAIGVLLGNGWYNHQSLAVWDFHKAPWRDRPTFCLNLRIVYEDGSTEVIASGDDWKTSLSPVTLNSIYTAEHYDARLEQKGWNTVDFDESAWKGVMLREAPSDQIVSQALHPIRNVEAIIPKSIKQLDDTTWVYDLGRNISGVSQIRVQGAEGTVVRVKHGERLYDNGRVDLSNIDVYYRPKDDSDPFQTDIYTLSGEGLEEFMPHFNYKGFQYVEVSSSRPLALTKESLTGHFMHSDVPVRGTLNSSSTLVNNIWKATNNSYLSNLFGYPTDCPQREKNGWTGDGHFAIETALFNYDGITVYEKWLADHRDEQRPNGVLPDIIPTSGWGYGTANGTDWTSTIAIIPWEIYRFYGDNRLLRDSYESIKKYVNYVESISPAGLTTFGRGDWVPVKSTSSLELTSSVYFFVDAAILAKAAKMFGKAEDEKYYSRLADKIKNAINTKYLDREKGIYASGTQTELSVPLLWKVVPEDMISKVAGNLARRVEQDGMHIDVGVLGAKAVLNALSENGHAEIAYKLASQDTYPSWGWWIVNGATTLYENWDLDAERDISMNHMMFGEIGAWFYKGLGGIRPDEAAPGFKHVVVEPHVPEGLEHFESSFVSPQGEIKSSWKKKGNQIIYSLVIPPNSTATFKWPSDKITLHRHENQQGTLELTSGTYEFTGTKIPEYVHQADPTIFNHNSLYYLFGTNDHNANQGFLVYTSPDLKNWALKGSALKKGDAFGDEGFWAPQVWEHQGKFYMAYTANEKIAIAQSDHPAGPYTQKVKAPLASATGEIDPYVFIDEDGKTYFYHVRLEKGNRIFVGEMSDDFSTVNPESRKECISAASGSWEDTASVPWKVAEGPTVIRHKDFYYLFYSVNDFRNPDYAVGYAVSKSPMGPWKKHAANPIISQQNTGRPGSGHGDILKGKDDQLYYVFHTHYGNKRVGPRKTAIVKLDTKPGSQGELIFTMDPDSFQHLTL